ncbi:RING finger and transmembrane domain-containing protein 2-like [Mytilus californianus]|uniref:RING finger and transmembrane domain-containing protein 2-like n=1 Tax=Mytilus californianus TaxID=6549 RepID=UPI002246218F|nr:RING finger and transmembrane domain-containing protein 2-like [Mytilus californianus]
MSHRRNMTENNSNQATMGSNNNQNWMRLNLPINNTGAISNQVGNAVSGIMPTIMGHNPHRIVVSRSSSVDANQSQPTPATQTTDNVNDFVLDLNRLQHNPDHAHSHDFLHQGLQIDPESLQDFGSDENMNENHEHSHERQTPPLTHLLSNSIIFIVIVLFKLLSDHILGVVVFLCMGVTFIYANNKLQGLVHQTSLRDVNHFRYIFSFLQLAVLMAANMATVYYVFRDQELWKLLLFQMPNGWTADFWLFLWMMVVTDYILKYATIILKCLISVVPFSSKKRGKYYMFIEHVMQLYRLVVTVLPWFHFLSDDVSFIFAAVLLLVYFIFKLNNTMVKIQDVYNAVGRLRTDVSYGTRPSQSDITSREESCPICQDDYKDPVMLACKHIFCESCVSVWFDREKTCPMCRTQIHAENPQWKDGSTSVHIQWY